MGRAIPISFIVLLSLIGMWFFGKDLKMAKKTAALTISKNSKLNTATYNNWKKKYPSVKKFVYTTESQNLPANLIHPGITVSEHFHFPEDGWYIGMAPEQVGSTHALHHADIIDNSRPNSFCTNNMANIVTATGEELTSAFFPLGYGYPLSKKADFLASMMYHNEENHPEPHVQTRYAFYYIPQKDANLITLEPFFFDVVGACDWGEYSISPHSNNMKVMDPEYIMQKSGSIVLIGTHMHHYAHTFDFHVNGTSKATFALSDSEEGNELKFPVFAPSNLHVKKGDSLGISASYENTSVEEINAMAEAIIYFVPDPRSK